MILICSIADEFNFHNSKEYEIWGFNKRYNNAISKMNMGDLIIFIRNGKKENVVGVATFETILEKKYNNDILCWKDYDKYPIQIKYANFINISHTDLHIKGQSPIRSFNKKKHLVENNGKIIDIETLFSLRRKL